ncbi:ferrous iron transport protein B [Rubinisphaera sp.]|uniref:ferrous iron transport protein B n=1 Tax=Rubinisphaera sp. TaxID=2024857 RepID=UPI000C0D63EA|nr:ferrous iron transport protein B [Rubinisphaera sp.]MBV09536.1 ferrous iron transport protein B [Rubinisphaera sp.]|tara:strand:- start:1625 stop:3868 length:2244 start_codon:yes stop_codon:yes gene_type:complete
MSVPVSKSETTGKPAVSGKKNSTSHAIAVIGNPNTGKSTLFNALAGMNAQVGNYPGVTVEKKVGRFRHEGREIQLIDLPGTYSLSPRTADEMVSVRVLLGTQKKAEPIDGVICIVDATHLDRNLYLFSQILDLGIPAILVLNMWDEVLKRDIAIDVQELENRLGVKVVPTSARKGIGLDKLKSEIVSLVENCSNADFVPPKLFPDSFREAKEQLQVEVEKRTGHPLPHYLAERLLLDVHGETEREVLQEDQSLNSFIANLRTELASKDCPIPAIEPRVRYQWVKQTLDGLVTKPDQGLRTKKDTLDQWLTHRFWGPVFFAAIMFLMFQAIYSWAGPLMEAIESLQGLAADFVLGIMAPGALRSLIIDGLIGGVGSVVVFLPQIAILFLFIAILEDCGYMSRAAYIMDRLMTRVGLSGKSFVPLMSSYACAIPGIMATRTIEDRKDRFVTILVAPLMSCSARLPVYLLMINAFIPNDSLFGTWIKTQAIVLFIFYILGAVVAVPIAWLLKKTWFKGEPAPFVMELPSFKLPSIRVVFDRVYDRSKAFVMRAGTLIFLTTVIVWAAGYFPGDHQKLDQVDAQLESGTIEEGSPEYEQLEEQRRVLAASLLNESFLGRTGHAIEPVVRPLGWDWRIGVGVLASFPAREVIVGTLGTIYSLGGDVDEEDPQLRDRLKSARHSNGEPVFNIPVALSVMVFFALCAQCGATLMVMRRETNSWKWPIFSFTYMTTLAYVGALLTYQIGMLFIKG